MIKKFKTSIFYILFIFIVTLFFIHILFPGKRVGYYFSEYLQSKYKVGFECKQLKLQFPFILKASGLQISKIGSKKIGIDQFLIGPDFLSLLTGKIGFFAKIRLFSGEADGNIRLGIIHPKKKFDAEINFSNIDISGVNNVLQGDYKISGKISGKADLKMKKGNGDVRIFSKLNNLSVQSDSFFIPLASLNVKELSINGKIVDKTFKLKKSFIRSKAGVTELDGDISNIYNPLYAYLNIKGKILPNTAYLARNRKKPAIGMAFSFLKGKKTLEYSINGNIRNPNFRMNQ